MVGRFLGKAPAFSRIVAMLNTLWGRKSKVTVSVKGKLYIFQFADKVNMDWVLENGPWRVDKLCLAFRTWSTDFGPERLDLTKLLI